MTTPLAANALNLLVPAWVIGLGVFLVLVIALVVVQGVGNGRPHS